MTFELNYGIIGTIKNMEIDNNTEAFRTIKDLMEEASKRDEMLSDLLNSCDLEDNEEYKDESENDLYGNRWE